MLGGHLVGNEVLMVRITTIAGSCQCCAYPSDIHRRVSISEQTRDKDEHAAVIGTRDKLLFGSRSYRARVSGEFDNRVRERMRGSLQGPGICRLCEWSIDCGIRGGFGLGSRVLTGSGPSSAA